MGGYRGYRCDQFHLLQPDTKYTAGVNLGYMGCVDGVWTMYEWYMGCVDGVWTMYEWYMGCVDGVWTMYEWYMGCVDGCMDYV